MRQLIKIGFMISDMAAWLIVMAGIIVAVTLPFVDPVYSSYQRLIGEQPVSFLFTVSTIVLSLSSALGAYLLSKRKPQGLFLMLLSCLIWLVSGNVYGSLIYGGFVIVIFGLPLLLSYLEAKTAGQKV